MEYEEPSLSELTNKQRSYKNIFDNVTVPYLMSTLQNVLDFIQDPTSCSIIIREQSPDQMQFLSVIPNFVTKESRYTLLPQQAQGLVKEIGRIMKVQGATLKVVVRRGSGRHRLKDVEIFKKSAATRGSNRKKITEDLYSIVSKKVEDYDPRQMFLSSLSRNNTTTSTSTNNVTGAPRTKPVGDTLLNAAREVEAAEKRTDISNSNRTSSNYSLKSSGIKWQAAGSADNNVAEDVIPMAHGRRGGRRTVGAKHSKLLEALATPLDCVPATRMMKKMGWTGGALGARGNGITEPIMPALDIVQGAGFGHSHPQSKRERERRERPVTRKSSRSNSSTPAEFRILVLENLLQLLRGEATERDFQMREAASRKQVRFINMALKSFNARKSVGLNTVEEKELISKIKEIYANSDTMIVEVEYANNYRTVTLQKTEKDNLVIKAARTSRRGGRTRVDYERDESSGSSSDAEPEPVSDALVFYSKRDISSIRTELRKTEVGLGIRSLKTLASHVAVFRAILVFVKSDLDMATIAFQQFKVSTRMKKFLRTCIGNINIRARPAYSTNIENNLYREIVRCSKSILNVGFVNGKHFTLAKEGSRTRKARSPSLTKAETPKTAEPMLDKHESETYIDGTDDKTKGYLDSDSEMSVISLKDYEVYDINLAESSSDESENSDIVQNDGLGRPWYSDKGILEEYNGPEECHENCKENGLDLIQLISLKTNISLKNKNKSDNDTTSLENKNDIDVTSISLENENKSDVDITTISLENENKTDTTNISLENKNKSDNDKTNVSLENKNDIDKTGISLKHKNDTDITNISLENKNDSDITNTSLQNKSNSDITNISLENKNRSVISNVTEKDLSEHNDLIAKVVDGYRSDSNNSPDLIIKNADTKTNDTEKLLSLCKVNNLDNFLNDDNAKVSVSIDIKMELNGNSQKTYTKEELIEKIENSPDINIDFGITNDIPNPPKRASEIFDLTPSIPKKSKLNYVIAEIRFLDNSLITKDVVITVQKAIFSKINENNLPLLKFINYDENSVNYRCDNSSSFDWLENLIENLSVENSKLTLTLRNELKKTRYKMKAVLSCVFELNPKDLLKKIELYNSGVKVDNWMVLDVKFENDLLVFILDIDSDSYMTISDSNFSLYCGFDAIEFSICHD